MCAVQLLNLYQVHREEAIDLVEEEVVRDDPCQRSAPRFDPRPRGAAGSRNVGKRIVGAIAASDSAVLSVVKCSLVFAKFVSRASSSCIGAVLLCDGVVLLMLLLPPPFLLCYDQRRKRRGSITT